MTLPDCLKRGTLGEIRFEGSRIDLYFVLDAYRQLWPAEAIAIRYETLRLRDIHEAIEFYEAHRNEVDAYLRDWEAKAAANLASGTSVDVETLKRRYAELHPERAAELSAQLGE